MFYEEEDPADVYRLGDLLQGYILGATDIAAPSTAPMDYTINVARPKFLVVLTPCCSIGGRTLVLAPLTQVDANLLKIPYVKEDLGRINRPMPGELAVIPQKWATMKEEDKEACRAGGDQLQFLALFVYEPHAFLEDYPLKSGGEEVVVGHYMVDFRQMHRVDCAKINRGDMPIGARALQLSVEARSLLRNKLINYFGRVPDEDQE